jgi:hypothetical protein
MGFKGSKSKGYYHPKYEKHPKDVHVKSLKTTKEVWDVLNNQFQA